MVRRTVTREPPSPDLVILPGSETTDGSRQETLDTLRDVEGSEQAIEQAFYRIKPTEPIQRPRRIHLKPFDSSEFVYVDKNLMSDEHRDLTQERLKRFLRAIPPLINCEQDCFWDNPLDVPVIKPDIQPITFGLFKERSLVGAFLMFNTLIVSETDRLLELKTDFIPAFDGLGRDSWDTESVKILNDVLNKSLEQRDTRQVVKIVEWTYPANIGTDFVDQWGSGSGTAAEYLTGITRPD